MENNIAPLPWRIEQSKNYNDVYSVKNNYGEFILYQDAFHHGLTPNKATCEYIVKCVNAYPKLIEFIKWCGINGSQKLLEELGE